MSKIHINDIMKSSGKEPDFNFNELEREVARVTSYLTFQSSTLYASVLMQCARIYTFKLPTLAVGVTNQVLLFINPDFFMGKMKIVNGQGKEETIGLKNIEERVAVVEHEILHLVLHHCTRGRKHQNHELSNIAADAVVNQFLKHKPPGDCVTLEKFQLPADKDLDTYYKLLSEKQNKKGEKSQQKQPGQGGQGQGSGGGGQSDKDNEKDPFSTSKNGRGNHDTWLDENQTKGTGKDATNEAIKNAGGEDGGLPNEAREAIVTDVVRQAAMKAGQAALSKLPGNLASYIEEMLRPKKATQPWNVILRRFTGTHGSSVVRSSKKYISKRFFDPVSGLRMRPGLRIKRNKKILVGIDTSGSMAQDDLNLLAGELSMIWRYNKDITVVECDTEIHRVYKFTGNLKSVCGRGGTDMWPIRRMFEKEEYDCCILMTDGYVGDIGDRPPRNGWLWVITHGGTEPAKWGMYVHLPDANTVEDR